MSDKQEHGDAGTGPAARGRFKRLPGSNVPEKPIPLPYNIDDETTPDKPIGLDELPGLFKRVAQLERQVAYLMQRSQP